MTKNYAMRQGFGGKTSTFDILKYGTEDGSSSQLNESFTENNTNAYMLIYVRETEREAIMADSLQLNE